MRTSIAEPSSWRRIPNSRAARSPALVGCGLPAFGASSRSAAIVTRRVAGHGCHADTPPAEIAAATAISLDSTSRRKACATAAPVSIPSATMTWAALSALPHMTLRPAVLTPSTGALALFFGSRGFPFGPVPRSAFPAPPGAT